MSLSVNNVYVKAHNNFLPELPTSRNFLSPRAQITAENNNQIYNTNKTVEEVWSKYNFDDVNNDKVESANMMKMSWADIKKDDTNNDYDAEDDNNKEDSDNVDNTKKAENEEEAQQDGAESKDDESPSHHARRPMNAFLIFCKKHRPIVRDRYPNLENRGVTKILGEWWALLDDADKAPYTGLAKEYKDAFLSANPNFKWYKLPAPPLRTLSVRPSSTLKISSPTSSPAETASTVTSSAGSDFNVGKLADESQLGSLTALISKQPSENNNNIDSKMNEFVNASLESPTNLIKQTSIPPKPFKKRNFEKYPDNKGVARNLLSDDEEIEQNQNCVIYNNNGENSTAMTNQDLMDKVVDKIYTKNDDYDMIKSRKSERQCKGKIYQKFMVEEKLLGNKRGAKLTSSNPEAVERDLKLENEFSKNETETPNLKLDHTIKRLAERTNMQKLLDNEPIKNRKTQNNSDNSINNNNDHNKSSSNCDFNLDLRISNLPSLSYDVFYQRKRESKKRKNRIRTDEIKSKAPKLNDRSQLVGSKKRKNKHSITHLEKKDDNNMEVDLLALATLAEVAANTQKINSEAPNIVNTQ